MTKNIQVSYDTTCKQVLQQRGFKPSSSIANRWDHLSGEFHVYVFGEDGPTQEWRIHIKNGESFRVWERGASPQDLNNSLANLIQ